ncbi:MAG: DUF4124 domain-containing protein [Acidovorax sp.]
MPATPLRAAAFSLTVCAALCAQVAQAQVNRCTDPRTGQVTYTDGDCAAGAQAREIEARKTPEQIEAERAQAAEALQRLREQQAADAEAESRKAAQQAHERTAPRPDYAHSAACASARKNVEAAQPSGLGTYEDQQRLQSLQRQMNLDCLGPERAAEIQAAQPQQPALAAPMWGVSRYGHGRVPAPAPAPPPITGCNVFRCFDGKGNSYPR